MFNNYSVAAFATRILENHIRRQILSVSRSGIIRTKVPYSAIGDDFLNSLTKLEYFYSLPNNMTLKVHFIESQVIFTVVKNK